MIYTKLMIYLDKRFSVSLHHGSPVNVTQKNILKRLRSENNFQNLEAKKSALL